MSDIVKGEPPRSPSSGDSKTFRRVLTWQGSFWITSGAAVAGLFSVGALAALAGTASIPLILISSLIGFVQLFLYAELAGIFPNKTGGGSIYGSVGWRKYGRLFVPINIGSYWFGISTSLTVFASLAGSYIVSFFLQGTSFAKFSFVLLNLSHILPGIVFQVNGPILIGAAILILVFAVQHAGISQAAKSQALLGIIALLPLILLIVGPFFTGKIHLSNFLPVALPGHLTWTSWSGISIIAAALYVTGWASYGCEQAVAYIAEFRNPARDGIRAIVSSGALGLVLFIGLPVVLVGALGLAEITTPDFINGYTQTAFIRLASATFGEAPTLLIVVALIAAIVLAMGTVVASSSRTLYQGSLDGVFPKTLGVLNANGVPGRGMWVDLLVNLVLMLLGSPLFVLAAGNVAYLLCVSMDVSSVRLLRTQYPSSPRPYQVPSWLANYGGPLLGIFNVGLILVGANTAAANSLWYGAGFIVLIVIVFLYRHYVTDKGRWPDQAAVDFTPPGVARKDF